MSAFVIDAFEFCRSNGHRDGVTPVAEMSRLARIAPTIRRDRLDAVDGSTSKQVIRK
jgi:uncharacterized protein